MSEEQSMRLADRARILDVLAYYCEQIDNYTIPRLSTIFTEDCVFDAGPGNGGPQAGNDFSAMVARQAAFRHTQHQLGQSRIEFTAEDAATGLTYATAWHERWDSSVIVARLRYVDEYQLRNGRWLIHRRRLEALGVEGGPTDAWNWVYRAAAVAS